VDLRSIESLELLEAPEELVTGEAVALDLRAASFASRALGLLLDVAVALAVVFGGILGLGLLSTFADGSTTQAATLVLVVAGLVGYPVIAETTTRGRSLGKLAAGLRVVRDDGGPVRFRQSLVRGLLAVPEIYLMPFIALIASLSSKRGKRLGDQLAGTFVIRTRTPRRPPAPPEMPPGLGAWASCTDLGRIPDPLATAARGFLQRSRSLHPGIRSTMAVQLADALAAHIAPPPPAGTDPEYFIAAVLAERRRRDLARLTAEAGRRQARERDRRLAPVLSPAATSLVGDTPRADLTDGR
jgi:uncharacterized RDD family membrane protein YckC